MKRVLILIMALVMIIASFPMSYAKGGNGNGNAYGNAGGGPGRGWEMRNQHKADILHEMGLLDGVSETEFDPDLDGYATRAQAIKMIGQSLGWEDGDDWDDYEDLESVKGFSDVPEWAAPYVAFAIDNNITKGIGDGKFGSDLPVTMKMVYVWYYRALLYTEDSWNNPDFLVDKGLVTEDQLDDILDNMDGEGSLRDIVVGIMFESLKWKPRGSDMSLIQHLVKSRWINENLARESGLFEDMTDPYVVKVSVVDPEDPDSLKIQFNEPVYATDDFEITIDGDGSDFDWDLDYDEDFDKDEDDYEFHWNAAHSVLTVIFDDAFDDGTYDIEISGFEDVDDNMTDDFDGSFTVGDDEDTTAPTVKSAVLKNVDFDTTSSASIVIRFSEEIKDFDDDSFTLAFEDDDLDFDDVDLAVTYDDDLFKATIKLTELDEDMEDEDFVLTLKSADIEDLAGNELAGTKVFDFTLEED